LSSLPRWIGTIKRPNSVGWQRQVYGTERTAIWTFFDVEPGSKRVATVRSTDDHPDHLVRDRRNLFGLDSVVTGGPKLGSMRGGHRATFPGAISTASTAPAPHGRPWTRRQSQWNQTRRADTLTSPYRTYNQEGYGTVFKLTAPTLQFTVRRRPRARARSAREGWASTRLRDV